MISRLTNMRPGPDVSPGLLSCPACGYAADPEVWRQDMLAQAQRALADFNAWFQSKKAAEEADALELGCRVYRCDDMRHEVTDGRGA